MDLSVIKTFTSNRWKIAALIIILISINIGVFLRVYYSTSDCKPIIEQKQELMKMNTDVMKKNKELLAGYLQIENLLKNVTHDTIYIKNNTTTTFKTIDADVVTSSKSLPPVLNSTSDSSIVFDTSPISDKKSMIKRSFPIKYTSSEIVVKTGNQKDVYDKIQKIISRNKN